MFYLSIDQEGDDQLVSRLYVDFVTLLTIKTTFILIEKGFSSR